VISVGKFKIINNKENRLCYCLH